MHGLGEVAGELEHRDQPHRGHEAHQGDAGRARRVRACELHQRPGPPRLGSVRGAPRVGLEAGGLGHPPTEPGEEQHRDQADEVQHPPPVGQLLAEGVEDHRQPVAADAERAEHADPPAAVLGGVLLGDHHEGDGGARHEEGPREHLERDELLGGLAEAREERRHAGDHERAEEDPPAPDAVREGDHQEGRQRPHADHAQVEPEVRLRDGEVGRDVGQRGRQHGEVVLLEEERERDGAEQAQVLGLDALGHPAQEGRDPPGVLPDGASSRAGSGFGVVRHGAPSRGASGGRRPGGTLAEGLPRMDDGGTPTRGRVCCGLRIQRNSSTS